MPLTELLGENEFDRSIEEVSEESTRIGSLVGAQIAVCAVLLVDKLADSCILPITLLFFLIVVVGVAYGVISLMFPITRRLTPFKHAEERMTVKEYLKIRIASNRKAAFMRAFLFYMALATTIFILIDAYIVLFRSHFFHT